MTTLRAVDRAIDILQCLGAATDGLKVVDLEDRTGLSRPTLYRFIGTLENRGLIKKAKAPMRYEIAVGLVELARGYLRNDKLLNNAHDALMRLHGQAHETVALYMMRGDFRTCIWELPGAHALTVTRGVGSSEKLVIGASGYAILAFETEARIRQLTGGLAEPALMAALARIRERGYATSTGTLIAGATAVTAPVFDGDRQVVGSVGIFGAAARLTPAVIAAVKDKVIAAGRQISDRLAAGAGGTETV